MDPTTIAAWISLGGLTITGLLTLFGKKVKAPTDKAAERRDTIAERDALIASFKDDIKALKEDVKAQKEETAALRTEVGQVRDHNNALITFIYRLIAIIRRHGHEDEIPDARPNGIHL